MLYCYYCWCEPEVCWIWPSPAPLRMRVATRLVYSWPHLFVNRGYTSNSSLLGYHAVDITYLVSNETMWTSDWKHTTLTTHPGCLPPQVFALLLSFPSAWPTHAPVHCTLPFLPLAVPPTPQSILSQHTTTIFSM